MTCLFAFVAGMIGNFASQSVRGFLGIIVCLASLALQLPLFGLALAQFAGGGREESYKVFSRAIVSSRDGTLGFLKGLARLAGALTLITPIMRGSQVVSEPFGITGIYAPKGFETWFQELVGLDSWEPKQKLRLAAVSGRSVAVSPRAKEVKKKPLAHKPRINGGLVLEGLVYAYREATTLERPQYWILRGSETRGPYSLERVLRGFREGKLKDSDKIASSLSNEWRDWIEFKKVAVTIGWARRRRPKDILNSIAIRHPRFYEEQCKAAAG